MKTSTPELKKVLCNLTVTADHCMAEIVGQAHSLYYQTEGHTEWQFRNSLTVIHEKITDLSRALQAVTALDNYGYMINYTTLKITSPGKFEGQPRWVPHFYQASLEGEGETKGTDDGYHIYITAEDIKTYPELREFYEVVIHEDDQGNVYGNAILEPPQEGLSDLPITDIQGPTEAETLQPDTTMDEAADKITEDLRAAGIIEEAPSPVPGVKMYQFRSPKGETPDEQ